MPIVEFGLVGQISGAPINALAGITDLLVYETAAGPVLLSVTRGGGQLVSYDIGAAPGQAHMAQSWQINSSLTQLESTDLAVFDAGSPVLYMAGLNSSLLLGLALNGNSPDTLLGGGRPLSVSGAEAASFTDIAFFDGSDTGIVAVRGGGLMQATVSAGGLSLATLAYGNALRGAAVGDLETAHVGGRDLAIATMWGENAVALFEMSPTGAVRSLGNLVAAPHSAWISLPTAAELVDVGGQAYAIVAAAGSDSLTVMEIAAGGGLSITDHVIDTLGTRFAGISVFEVAEVNGMDIVIAAGADDGLTAFVLLPGGRLHHLATIEGSADLPLSGITEIALQPDGNGIRIFVATQAPPYLSEVSLTLPNPGIFLAANLSGGTLAGTGRNDVLAGDDGADRIEGGGGDDILLDGAGADTLVGGAGADEFLLTADGAVDIILGFQPGTDRIDLTALGLQWDFSDVVMINRSWGVELQFGDEVVELHSPGLVAAQISARDFVSFGHVTYDGTGLDIPPSLQSGSAGNDRMSGGDGAERITGLAGHDRISANGGDDTIWGEGGNDVLSGGGGNDSVLGGADNDVISGNAGNDTAMGESGDDHILGGGGDDHLDGGTGRDRIVGDAGDDLIFGGDQQDTLLGSTGNDTMDGGGGADTLRGNGDHDVEHGGGGDDVVIGGTGRDTLYGDSGNDIVRGNGGFDSVMGGNGDDEVYGGAQADRVDGGSGNDSLFGGGGFDSIYAGNGDDDVMTGNFNADRFIFADGHGDDTITDFEATNNAERIDLSGISAITSLADLNLGSATLGAATQVGEDVVIGTGGGNSITLWGVSLADLDAADFIF